MICVRVVVFVMLISCSVWAAAGETKYVDHEIHLVVGDQQLIRGEFDSQLTFSKKGLVNIRWLSDDSFLLTALKSGVLIIDPTPITKNQRRYLVKIQTPYQSQRDQKHKLKRFGEGFGEYSSSLYFDPLVEARFKGLITQHHQNAVVLDCYHLHKKEFVFLLTRVHPTMNYRCDSQSYHLEVALGSFHHKDMSSTEPRLLFEHGLPALSTDQSKQAQYRWNLDIYPTTTALNYEMKRDHLGVVIKDLSYTPISDTRIEDEARAAIIAFHYEFSVDGVFASGHISKPYKLGQLMLISALRGGEDSNRQSVDLMYENIPFVGFLIAARKNAAVRSLMQMWIVFDRPAKS